LVIIDSVQTGNGLVRGSIRVDDRKHDLGFESELELSGAGAEAFLLLALPAAMRCGGPLIIEAPVSPQLLRQLPAIQAIYSCWDPNLRQAEIRATARSPGGQVVLSSQPREGVAFTAGVDSFYSALKSPDTSLVYIHGLDIPLGNTGLRNRVSEKLSWVASELNRPLLEMETNLRDFSDRYLTWHLAFGGALSACALLLSRHLDVFGIPAGQSYESLLPDGAHPVLNPLFSTENVAVRSVGCETRRVDKVKNISSHPVVHNALRVCWENRGDAYNCGVCEKCLRTMAALEIFGNLSDCSTFDVALDYGRLSRAVAAHPSLEMFIQQNLQAARENEASPELIRSLEKSLHPGRTRLFRTLHNTVPHIINDWSYRVFRRKRTRK